MKDEIKETLKALKHYDFSLDVSEKVEIMINKLLDYITNLQEEINKLTAESTEWESKCYDLQQQNERLNKIINELENYLFGQLQLYGGGGMVQEYYDKIKELKGE